MNLQRDNGHYSDNQIQNGSSTQQQAVNQDQLCSLSIVLPVYNERDSLNKLNEQLFEVLEGSDESWEIIYVDDGSTDGSYSVLQDLCESDDRVKLIKLRGNFGQSAALDAGLRHSNGQIIVTMDSDLQNDPDDIFRLVSILEDGYDCVSGWRKNRNDTFGKRFFSTVASSLRQLLLDTELHDYGCTLKAYTREAADEIRLQGEMHRYIPPLLKWKGYNVTEIEVNHRPREHGSSKYSWKRLLKGFIDLINVWFWKKFSTRPLHIFGGLGIVSVSVGLFSGLIMIGLKIFAQANLSETALSLFTVFMIMIGVQFFLSGILADICIKGYQQNKNKTPYRIKEYKN